MVDIEEGGRKESMPMWYRCTLRDMVDQINMELDTCINEKDKMEFRILRKGIKDIADYYDAVTFDDDFKRSLK